MSNNKLEIGQVVYVKTSEEPVVVLGTRKMHADELGKTFPEVYNGSGDVVVVRRPVATETTGLSYKLYDFLIEELETEEAQSKRLFNKLIERQKISQAEFSIDPLSKIVKPS